MKKYRTRSGLDVVVYCTDAPDTRYPVHGRVGSHLHSWTANFRYFVSGEDHELDLFEVPEETVVWVNVYSDGRAYFRYSREAADEAAFEDRVSRIRVVLPHGRFDD